MRRKRLYWSSSPREWINESACSVIMMEGVSMSSTSFFLLLPTQVVVSSLYVSHHTPSVRVQSFAKFQRCKFILFDLTGRGLCWSCYEIKNLFNQLGVMCLSSWNNTISCCWLNFIVDLLFNRIYRVCSRSVYCYSHRFVVVSWVRGYMSFHSAFTPLKKSELFWCGFAPELKDGWFWNWTHVRGIVL